MSFKKSVERWRAAVESEVELAGSIVSPNLVLAVMQRESGGIPGTVTDRQAVDGSFAAGLMQTIQSTLDTYNRSHAKIEPEQLRGTSAADAAAQIRVGLWVLDRYWTKIYDWAWALDLEFALPDFIPLVAASYLMGPGKSGGKKGVIPKLEKMRDEGIPVDWEHFKSRWGSWGWSEKKQKWINRPCQYGDKVWSLFLDGEIGRPYPESDPDLAALGEKAQKLGFALGAGVGGILVILTLWWIVKRL